MPVHDGDGRLLGVISDICINENGIVSHYLLHGKGLVGKKYMLPIKDVFFGENAITIKDRNILIPYKGNDPVYTMTHGKPLEKIKSFSQNGEMLGLLDDVYFMEEVGTIVGYELTDGFFSDISKGKRVIRTPHPPKIGKENIIMSVNKLRGGHSHDEMSELPKQGPR